MEENQAKKLASLAKKIKSEKKDRMKVVSTLQAAKILNKKENFTVHYSNLEKVITHI